MTPKPAPQQKTATKIMLTVLENVESADDHDMMVCQDTGLPIYKRARRQQMPARSIVEVKKRLQIGGGARDHGISSALQYRASDDAQEHADQYRPGHSASSSSISSPDSDKLEIRMAPKGSGSENMSFLQHAQARRMGSKRVKQFVLECVFESGANPCPPVIVGIGLGGTSDVAAAMAKEASCFRQIGTQNADPSISQAGKRIARPHQPNRHRPAGPGRRDDRDGRPYRMGPHAHLPASRRREHAVLAWRTGERDHRCGWKHDSESINVASASRPCISRPAWTGTPMPRNHGRNYLTILPLPKQTSANCTLEDTVLHQRPHLRHPRCDADSDFR